jgi:hypothetical protein
MEHMTTSVFFRRIWLACVIGMAAAIPFGILATITLVLYANQQLSATDFASVLRLTLGSVIYCVLCAAPKNRLIGTVLGGIAFGVMITLAIAWEAIFGPILCTGIGFVLTVIPRSFVDKMMENQLPIKKTVGVILILSTGVGVLFMFAQLGAKLG